MTCTLHIYRLHFFYKLSLAHVLCVLVFACSLQISWKKLILFYYISQCSKQNQSMWSSLPGLHTFPLSLFVLFQAWSGPRPVPHPCSGPDESRSLPGSLPPFQAWSCPWSLLAAQPWSGPRSWPVIQDWSGPLWVLSLPGIHVWSWLECPPLPEFHTWSWGRSLPGAQESGPRSLLEFQLWSWGWDCSPLASGPWGQRSFATSLGGSLAVGGPMDPGSDPLARPSDDITEQLVVE